MRQQSEIPKRKWRDAEMVAQAVVRDWVGARYLDCGAGAGTSGVAVVLVVARGPSLLSWCWHKCCCVMPRWLSLWRWRGGMMVVAMVAQAVVRDWVGARCLDCGAGAGTSGVACATDSQPKALKLEPLLLFTLYCASEKNSS